LEPHRLPKSPYPKLVLGSASPRRKQLLSQLGIKPAAVDPCQIDESPLPGEAPGAYVRRLALEKVDIVSKKHKGAVVLAADTAVAVGKRILGKPETRAEAEQFLKLLSGRRHRVYSAVAVAGGAPKPSLKTSLSIVTFKRLTINEISWYLESGEWQGKAGAYAIQGKAGAFIKSLKGSYSGVVGLPLYETACLLNAHGFQLKIDDK